MTNKSPCVDHEYLLSAYAKIGITTLQSPSSNFEPNLEPGTRKKKPHVSKQGCEFAFSPVYVSRRNDGRLPFATISRRVVAASIVPSTQSVLLCIYVCAYRVYKMG